MKIDKYSFGKIIIDGKTYSSDIKIVKNKISDEWWRKAGHSLCEEDLADIIDEKPKTLIIGTGFFGVLKVPGNLITDLENKGIECKALQTTKAVEIFNEMSDKESVAFVAHLTC